MASTNPSEALCKETVNGEIPVKDKPNKKAGEMRSKYVYYDYKANQEIPETYLGRTLYFLERKKKSSLNRMHQIYLATKDELKELEIQRSKIKSRRKEITNKDKEEASVKKKVKPSRRHIFRLDSSISMMSDRQKSVINQRSFEHLKSKYQQRQQDVWNPDNFERPSVELVTGRGRIKNGSKSTTRRKDISTTRQDNSITVVDVKFHNATLPHLRDRKVQTWLTVDDCSYLDEDRELIHEKIDPETLYSFSLNASVNLPKISQIRPRLIRMRSAREDTSEEGEDWGQTYEGIKSCRYIRGFEPAYMRTPRDINRFIFRKKRG